MSDQMELKAEERSVTGKQVKRLRQQGLVPAVLYGHNVESVPVQVKRDELAQLLRRGGRAAIVELKMGRKRPISVAIKGMHIHPLSGELLHVDFYRVAAGEKLKMQVPLHFVGEAPVTKSHEVAIVRAVDQVEVECYPKDLPSFVSVDLNRLDDLGTSIRVSDLEPPANVTILSPSDEVIVSVAAARREAVEVEEAAAVEEVAEPTKEGEGEDKAA